MVKDLKEMSKLGLAWTREHGFDWFQKNHPGLLQDALYYGYLTQEILLKANLEFKTKNKVISLPKTPKKEEQAPVIVVTLEEPQEKKEKIRISNLQTLFYTHLPEENYIKARKQLQDICIQDPENAQPLYQRKDGSKIYTPLTLQETVLAMVDDYNTASYTGRKRDLEDRLELFNFRFSTCSAVIFSEKTNKCKIIPCFKPFFEQLPSKGEPQVYYESYDEEELDLMKIGWGNDYYSKEDVLKSPFWVKAVDDQYLLSEFASIIFKHMPQPRSGMAVWVLDTQPHESRVLTLNSLDNYSYLEGDAKIQDKCKFLYVMRLKEEKNYA